MKTIQKALFCALTAVLAAGPAYAGDPEPVVRPVSEARVPNVFGATGLLTIPSAYVQGDRAATGHIFGTSDFFGGGILGGIGRRFEAGFMVLDVDNADTEFLLNAKYQVLTERDNRPAIAVGAIDILDELNQDPSWYVVVSKYFTRSEIEQRFALKGHVGFGGGIYDEELFGGLELFFTRNLSALADFSNGDFHVGGRYTHRGFAITLGLFNDLDHFGGGVSYTFRY